MFPLPCLFQGGYTLENSHVEHNNGGGWKIIFLQRGWSFKVQSSNFPGVYTVYVCFLISFQHLNVLYNIIYLIIWFSVILKWRRHRTKTPMFGILVCGNPVTPCYVYTIPSWELTSIHIYMTALLSRVDDFPNFPQVGYVFSFPAWAEAGSTFRWSPGAKKTFFVWGKGSGGMQFGGDDGSEHKDCKEFEHVEFDTEDCHRLS